MYGNPFICDRKWQKRCTCSAVIIQHTVKQYVEFRKASLRLQLPWIDLLSVTSSRDGGREVATVHGNIPEEETFDGDIL